MRKILVSFFIVALTGCGSNVKAQPTTTSVLSAAAGTPTTSTIATTTLTTLAATTTTATVPTTVATSKAASATKTPEDIVTIFRAAGLEAEEPFTMGPKDYGLAPLLATKGLRFLIPSLGPDTGGRIMQFNSDAELETVRAYYVDLGRASAALFSWTYSRDGILVQINGQLEPAVAAKYEAALAGA